MTKKVTFALAIGLMTFTAVFGRAAESPEREQFWIKTTTQSLTIDWNCRTCPAQSIMAVKLFDTASDELFWQGSLSGEPLGSVIRFRVSGLLPELWSPVSPNLYRLELSLTDAGSVIEEAEYRIGFRSFETREEQLFLNGHPVFLRGIAINPPGRGIPQEVETSRAFAEEYVKFMKSIHVNIIRIPDNPTWYEVCDEAGMMVFGGNYSVAVAGGRIPEVYDDGVKWYKEVKFAPFVHHPSLVIWSLTNEVPYKGDIAREWVDFLSYAYRQLKEWDPTRSYIGNAGYGYGQSGDICDLHRYWGWYYASPFTFLHIRDYDSITFPRRVQPLTFTECVGNYTGPDGRYNLTPNHKNPVSQKNWTGHAPQYMQANLADQHQCFVFKQATELMRRLRRINSESSGVFPFTIMFRNWHTVSVFTDMDPKPVAWQARTSYQPVLLSWENWQSQVYAGAEIHPVAHVINESDDFSDLRDVKLIVKIMDKALTTRRADTILLPDIPYYTIHSERVTVKLPATLFEGEYQLEGHVLAEGREVSRNAEPLFISQPGFSVMPDGDIYLFDPGNSTYNALQERGIKPTRVTGFSGLEPAGCLILGENSVGLIPAGGSARLKEFVKNGGRLIILKQEPDHQEGLKALLPVNVSFPEMDIDDPSYPPPIRPSRNGFNINPERPGHPVFQGIDRSQLRVWSDYTGWDESKPGMPAIYPVSNGFIMPDREEMKNTAVLANYCGGLKGIALAEFFHGDGSVLVCGFDLASRSGIDPVADRLLYNMVNYMAHMKQHEIHPLITAPILWGEYETEKGLLTGIYSGLMLNSKPALYGSYEKLPLLLLEDGHLYGEKGGGWNNAAGKQYVPYGRRMFGPYFHRGFGGVPTPVHSDSRIGEGTFWCRVPEGTERLKTLVWNPADMPFEITIGINQLRVSAENISPGEYRWIESALPNGETTLRIDYSGDRRLVLLQTEFMIGK